MGQLIDGIWNAGSEVAAPGAAFARAQTTFRNHIVEPVAGRYHLYVAYACPWAHRVLIARALRGLEPAIGVTHVDPHMGENGWAFKAEDPDPLGGRFLRDVYLRADPKLTARVTVPVLWDRETGTIVNNESREVMRILDTGFGPLASGAELAPEALRPEIDRILDAIYEPINNGVYRAGFARSQHPYETAVRQLFDALAQWDAHLAERRYLCGDRLTEADIALFTTCLRFDLVYYGHFKCNVRRLRDHPNLWAFTRRMWRHPAIRATCQLDEIKTHYYWSQDHVNPTRIVPVGPADYVRDLDA